MATSSAINSCTVISSLSESQRKGFIQKMLDRICTNNLSYVCFCFMCVSSCLNIFSPLASDRDNPVFQNRLLKKEKGAPFTSVSIKVKPSAFVVLLDDFLTL